MELSASTVLGILGFAAAAIGGLWGYWRFLDGKIDGARDVAIAHSERVRLEAAEALATHRAETSGDMRHFGAQLDTLRADCARRDDIGRLESAVGGVHRRLDQVLQFLATGKAV